MEFTMSFGAPAEKIYADLTSIEFWNSAMDVYRANIPEAEVTSFSSDEGGTDIEFMHCVPRSELPPVARNLMPVDVVISRSQHFEPYDHTNNRALGTYTATVRHGPGELTGSLELTDTDDGSQLRIRSVCRVWIPVIGGKLEKLILDGLAEVFTSEEEFAADWIAEHH
jgi:hypothetical protein